MLQGRLHWWFHSAQPLRRKISRYRFGGKTQRVLRTGKRGSVIGGGRREFGTDPPPPWRKTIKLNTNAYPVFRRPWYVCRQVGIYNVIITKTAQKAAFTYNITYLRIYRTYIILLYVCCMYIKAVDGSHPPTPPNPVRHAPKTYETLYYNTRGRMCIPLCTPTCYIHYDFGVE